MNRILLCLLMVSVFLISSCSNKFDGENGVLKEYYEIGNGQALKKVAEYKDGVLNGPYLEYYSNGNVKTDAHYVKGELEGVRKHFFENGKMKAEETYKGGKRNGLYKYYYKNGNVETERYFQNGLKHGMYTQYYKNGKPEFTYNYSQDKMQGENKEYYDNGQVKYIAFFDQGDPAVGLQEFTKDGEVINNDFAIFTKEENTLALKQSYKYVFNIASSSDIKLYEGQLRENKYFDKSKYYDLLNVNDNGYYQRRYLVYPGEYEMSDLNIIATKETEMGNLYIKTKKIRVSLNNYF
ncbi:MAG: phophatidylinositol-4-phosphate 5-kinase [Chitinophagaceae bacterium]|nr:phophatidylinositol-4-phosphate 5-kinase [Chitinophagaceae bacterium]